MIRVLLVDDQPLIRTGLRALLDAEDDLEVVGEAGDGAEGVELAAQHRPDVVLMDVQMPGTDGIEATRRIAEREDLRDTRVVVLTNYGLDEYVFDALRAGAAGFLVKDTDPAELVQGLRVVAEGAALLSPTITRTLIGEFVSRPAHQVDGDAVRHLTPREREVVALVGHGLSNAEIAERLVVSPTTAKTHVSRAMAKVHARDRAQLVVFAYESGLVQARTSG
ncbi:MAG TPA: response regulator transcription factor [Actinotalea caeni]|uniref:response regulator n=1 Tax=Actinotalea caeni TaxID=1348467 RepID=UPI0012E2D9BA|nr:response regulator transcription factor [Actinotalea caeni]HLV55492.1 response regulator transcription factor [Actinotalea caeni]